MKNLLRHSIKAILGLVFFIIIGCTNTDTIVKDVSDGGTELGNPDNEIIIAGFAQKGPAGLDTLVDIYFLDDIYIHTDISFSTKTDDFGRYSFPSTKTDAQYVELFAEGFYYDEIVGSQSSTGPLTLTGLTDRKRTNKINVNVLTTLAKMRLMYLMETGMSFEDANEQTWVEVLKIFKIEVDFFTRFEDMNMLEDGDANGILLAVSALMMQMAHNEAAGDDITAEITAIIVDISNDIKTDGILNDETLLSEIDDAIMAIDVTAVRSNMENEYPFHVIPPFEQYIIKWIYDLGVIGATSPVLDSTGNVILGTSNGIYSIDSEGGSNWAVPVSGNFLSSAALDADDTIYVGNADGGMRAIYQDGTPKWSALPGEIIYSSPAIGYDGTIYIGTNEGIFYALNPDDGSQIWDSYTANGNLYFGGLDSSPALRMNAVGDGEIIYFGSYDGNLYALDSLSGVIIWNYNTNDDPPPDPTDRVNSSPAIGSDGTIYVASNNGRLHAVDPSTGNELWVFDFVALGLETNPLIESSPVIDSDGFIYISTPEGNLYKIDPNEPGHDEYEWVYETEGNYYSTPAIGANGTIYYASETGNFHAINSDGTLKWMIPLASLIAASPVIGSDGTIYISTLYGTAYAIQTNSGGLADSPWPMFRNNARHTGRNY